MPSRQERRKAERDAAKRAPAKAGAGGAAGAAAARTDVNVTPLGDWRTQAADPAALIRALGAEVVKKRAAKGEAEAQFSQGCQLVVAADGAAGTTMGATGRSTAMGANGRSPKGDIGLELCTEQLPVSH
jgi:hypothetical protein